MVRYKATISYDGTLFSGFQRQPNARSIQEELEKTLLRLNSGTPAFMERVVQMQVFMPMDKLYTSICPRSGIQRSYVLVWIRNVQMILMLLVSNSYQKNFMHDTINTVKLMSS